jgi:hypothetical protein
MLLQQILMITSEWPRTSASNSAHPSFTNLVVSSPPQQLHSGAKARTGIEFGTWLRRGDKMKLFLLGGATLLALAVSEPAARATLFDFAYTGSLVTFTVPATDTYQILAFGAQGGSGALVFPFIGAGGLGAEIGGDFSLTAGETLQIAVGGAGGDSTGSGGGGSLVVGPSNTPLVIAGGGGGGGATVVFPLPGQSGLTGPDGGGSDGSANGGNGGNGGGAGLSLVSGGGGGGAFSGRVTPPSWAPAVVVRSPTSLEALPTAASVAAAVVRNAAPVAVAAIAAVLVQTKVCLAVAAAAPSTRA